MCISDVENDQQTRPIMLKIFATYFKKNFFHAYIYVMSALPLK
jgi:hypothetical protein